MHLLEWIRERPLPAAHRIVQRIEEREGVEENEETNGFDYTVGEGQRTDVTGKSSGGADIACRGRRTHLRYAGSACPERAPYHLSGQPMLQVVP